MNRPPMPTVMRRKSSIPQATIKVSQEGNKDKVQRKSSKDYEAIFHANDILEAAKRLELNIILDTELLWIAEEFLLSPIPENWEEVITEEDHVYYVDKKNGKTQWEHPLENYYRGLIYMRKGCQEKLETALHLNPPSSEEIGDMANYYGIDLNTEHYLLDVLKEAVCMPLPPGWEEDEKSGNFIHEGKSPSLNHPLDPYFLEKIRQERLNQHRQNNRRVYASRQQEEALHFILDCKKQGKAPYEILGISQKFSKAQIRKQFRYMSLLVHPDKNPSAKASEAFKILSEAYKAI